MECDVVVTLGELHFVSAAFFSPVLCGVTRRALATSTSVLVLRVSSVLYFGAHQICFRLTPTNKVECDCTSRFMGCE